MMEDHFYGIKILHWRAIYIQIQIFFNQIVNLNIC